MWRIWPIIILCLCACSQESERISRDPDHFCTDEMGITLESIPHQEVDYFNGEALVLSITPAEYQSLRADPRFQWQKYPDASNANVKLFDWQFIDAYKYDVLVCQRSEYPEPPMGRWRLFGLDKTRSKFGLSGFSGWKHPLEKRRPLMQ